MDMESRSESPETVAVRRLIALLDLMEKPESPVTGDKRLLRALLDLMMEFESIPIKAGSLRVSTALLKLAANLRLDDDEGDEAANARIRQLRSDHELLPLREQVSAIENLAISMRKKKQEIDTRIEELETGKRLLDRQRTALTGSQLNLKHVGTVIKAHCADRTAAREVELTEMKRMIEARRKQADELSSAQRNKVFSSPTLQVSCLCVCVLFVGVLLKARSRRRH